MHDLGTLGTDPDSYATGINDHGQAAGSSYGTSAPHGFLILRRDDAESGNPRRLGLYAYSINDSGQVVGYYYSSSMTNVEYGHAFIYSGGTMTDLNSLVDPALGLTIEQATAINDQGWIVASGHPTDNIIDLSMGTC